MSFFPSHFTTHSRIRGKYLQGTGLSFPLAKPLFNYGHIWTMTSSLYLTREIKLFFILLPPLPYPTALPGLETRRRRRRWGGGGIYIASKITSGSGWLHSSILGTGFYEIGGYFRDRLTLKRDCSYDAAIDFSNSSPSWLSLMPHPCTTLRKRRKQPANNSTRLLHTYYSIRSMILVSHYAVNIS